MMEHLVFLIYVRASFNIWTMFLQRNTAAQAGYRQLSEQYNFIFKSDQAILIWFYTNFTLIQPNYPAP